MQLFTVRHGETDYNKKKIVMGSRIDASLNEAGRAQVRALLPKLEGKAFETMYVSPLARTKETAEIIQEVISAPIVYRDELKERDAGTLSGKQYAEVKDLAGTPYGDAHYNFRPFGGESDEDVHARVKNFLRDIEHIHGPHDDTGTEILVVTHAEIIRQLYALFDKKPAESIHNVCVHKFKEDV